MAYYIFFFSIAVYTRSKEIFHLIKFQVLTVGLTEATYYITYYNSGGCDARYLFWYGAVVVIIVYASVRKPGCTMILPISSSVCSTLPSERLIRRCVVVKYVAVVGVGRRRCPWGLLLKVVRKDSAAGGPVTATSTTSSSTASSQGHQVGQRVGPAQPTTCTIACRETIDRIANQGVIGQT